MSVGVEKRFQLASRQAEALERLARDTGTTESTLVEEALDLLFRERSHSGRKIEPSETAFVVGTPLSPDRIIRPRG